MRYLRNRARSQGHRARSAGAAANAFVRRLVCSLGLVLASALPAAAHPLGNFTINHLTKISVVPGQVRVRYVLDMAEIPTFALMRAQSGDGRMTSVQLAAWSRAEVGTILPQLDLRLDGVRASLRVDGERVRTRRGAGGLPLLYWVLDAHANVTGGPHRLAYADQTFAGRLGWKDVVALPATEPTHELLAYPSALLGSPRNVTQLEGRISHGGAFIAEAVRSTGATAAGAPAVTRSNQLSDMLARGTGSPLLVLFTLLVAVALGALHALEPGHGKTLLAVSLVGARATTSQAAILAGSLTMAHTIGVVALGVAVIAIKGSFVPESIYPWITLLSGIVIAVIGARAIARAVMARQSYAHAHAHAHSDAHPHEHPHEHHPHEHAHGHAAGHAHDDEVHARSHAIGGTAPLRFGPTVWAAMSGGVAPCPAALVVLFAAIAQNAVAYGLVVIVFFSFGLAATLTGLGIGVVRGASWLSRRKQFDRFVRYAPFVSAIVIATIGCVMVGQGFVQQGIAVSAPLVTALTAAAIAGYAFSHPFHHARSVSAT